MARVCQILGKRPLSGNHVSHAKNRTRRKFMPNLHKRRLWLAEEKRFIKVRLSTKALRMIDKLGLKSVLKNSKLS